MSQFPESWQGTVIAVSNSARKEKLKLSEVVSLVLTEEVRRGSINSSDSHTSGLALSFEQQRGRIPSKDGRNQNRSMSKSKCKGKRSKAKSQVRSIKGECWNCGHTCHMSQTCKAQKMSNNVHEAHVVHDALILAMNSDTESWMIDSGASFYATLNREVLHNYVAWDFGKVYLGDDKP